METISVNLDKMSTSHLATAPSLYPTLQSKPQSLSPPMKTQSRPETPNVIVVQNQVPPAVGHEPHRLTCPHCRVRMVTRIEPHSTFRTHLVAALFCFMGCFCLAPLPYMIQSCKSLDHYCSHCDQYIGKASP